MGWRPSWSPDSFSPQQQIETEFSISVYTTACHLSLSLARSIQSTPSRHISFFLLWRCDPTRVMPSSFLMFLDHTQRCTTVGRTPLDEWSACRRDLYLTTHDTHNRQTSMTPGGIRTHDLSRRAAADLRLRPRGYWDGHHISLRFILILSSNICLLI